MKAKYLPLILLIVLPLFLTAQVRTVGTLLFDEENSLDGYTFFSPFNGRSAYMVDNCGGLVNQWERGTLPGLSAYFLNSGLMLRTYKVNPQGPFTSASNAGGLELVDWDNNVVWSFELNTDTELSHHDAVILPNGNFLLHTWELIFEDELVALGRDPNQIAQQGFAWNEKIIEIRPIGSNDAEVVWEWKVKDHYIQDRDSNLANFGVISDHPELFDINLADISSSNSFAAFDYNHFNAIDYNEELDQILISARNSDEIWIIDHSTTTEEAAGHTGGNAGMGGDILYRWGNASAYQGAPVSEQKLFGQHGVHWLRNGPEAGNIFIFNNGNGRPGTDFSTVEILEPPINPDGTYQRLSDNTYGPEGPIWMYGDAPSEFFYSPFLSNAQYLANGNFLINSGSRGNIFEITPEKEIVWEYEIPLFGDFAATQGDNINNNSSFRAYKFPVDYEGFDGLEIVPGATIETDPNPFVCERPNSVIEQSQNIGITITNTNEYIQFQNPTAKLIKAHCYDLNGRLINSFQFSDSHYQFATSNFATGVYFIKATTEENKFITQQIAIIR